MHETTKLGQKHKNLYILLYISSVYMHEIAKLGQIYKNPYILFQISNVYMYKTIKLKAKKDLRKRLSSKIQIHSIFIKMLKINTNLQTLL